MGQEAFAYGDDAGEAAWSGCGTAMWPCSVWRRGKLGRGGPGPGRDRRADPWWTMTRWE